MAPSLTPSELTLRGLLRVVGAGLLFAALVYLAGGFIGGFFRELPFVSNSVVKVTVLGLACLYAAGNVRGRRAVVTIVIAAHLVSVAAMAVMLIFAETARTVDLWLFDATHHRRPLGGDRARRRDHARDRRWSSRSRSSAGAAAAGLAA